MQFDLNNPESWSGVIPAPPFGVSGYQEKLNRICGLNPQGKPNVLLTWMPDRENWTYYFIAWGAAGFGTDKVPRAQYVFNTLNDYQDIPPPRWAIKQWQSGAQYAATDNLTRWKKRDNGGITEYRETRLAHPEEGRYVPLLKIGKHNGFCCKSARSEQKTCFGDYREPDESYLTWLAIAVEQRKGQDPNEPITQETLREAGIEAANIIREENEQKQANLKGWADENWKQIFADYTGDKTFLDTTEYSIPTKVSKGGILLP